MKPDPNLTARDVLLDSPQFGKLGGDAPCWLTVLEAGGLVIRAFWRHLEFDVREAGLELRFNENPSGFVVQHPERPELGFAISTGHVLRVLLLTESGEITDEFKALHKLVHANMPRPDRDMPTVDDADPVVTGHLFLFTLEKLCDAVKREDEDEVKLLRQAVLTDLMRIAETQKSVTDKHLRR